MYVIRLLLDNGYSMMAVRSFLVEYDGEGRELAILQLVEPGKNENLIYRADRYMETIGGFMRNRLQSSGFLQGDIYVPASALYGICSKRMRRCTSPMR